MQAKEVKLPLEKEEGTQDQIEKKRCYLSSCCLFPFSFFSLFVSFLLPSFLSFLNFSPCQGLIKLKVMPIKSLNVLTGAKCYNSMKCRYDRKADPGWLLTAYLLIYWGLGIPLSPTTPLKLLEKLLHSPISMIEVHIQKFL